ncbi:tyrosine-type recombinase/integrase [Bradyrhizobium sp. 150]|uniref:tyrosine-type recombinase/integrase n=1 Tax=Bradyrhizobium sp. 150 TaxID=2782625 RepID=UPI001FF8C13B|nr:tyrosine-type recombinase/integrase [Bradyrhizobium sp. 150]
MKLPKYVHGYTNRHGKTVFYYRRPGQKKVRLKIGAGVLPWSPTFMDAYEQAQGQARSALGASRTVPGTVNAALVSYYQSVAFTKGLAISTQKTRRAILENFRKDHGDKRIALMHTAALQIMIGGKTPAAQRGFKKAMRGFIDHCMELGMLRADPLLGLKFTKLKKSSGFLTWTEDDITKYRERHASGTKARLALELILQTGHARSDAVRMGRQHVKAGTLSMRRQKTGVAFDIPLLPDLLAELTHQKANQLFYLTTEYGKPFTAAGFGNWFADRCREAAVPGRAHGLRKASAVRHALNGATAPELMAWHGWKTISEAQRYIEEANRIKLAASAGAKMRTGIGSPQPGEPDQTAGTVENT